ncbi:MAG: SemiSWEET transporter [Spirochaetales bacterium]|nr:SemiSWEET transporter [Spirochaetales bacterium]
MNFTTLIGLLGAACTTGSFLPQVIKTLKTGDTKSISLLMYCILDFGVVLWLVYGFIVGDLPLIVANIITFSFVSIVLVVKIRNG